MSTVKWTVTFFNKSVRDTLLKLPLGILAKYARLTTLMESYGPNIGMPHTRHMSGGLIELRISAREGIARVFYCTLAHYEIVILHSFNKKTEKTPKRELEIANKRLVEVKQNEKVKK